MDKVTILYGLMFILLIIENASLSNSNDEKAKPISFAGVFKRNIKPRNMEQMEAASDSNQNEKFDRELQEFKLLGLSDSGSSTVSKDSKQSISRQPLLPLLVDGPSKSDNKDTSAMQKMLADYIKENSLNFNTIQFQYDAYPIMATWGDICYSQFILNYEMMKAGVDGLFDVWKTVSSGESADTDLAYYKQGYGFDFKQLAQLRPEYQRIISDEKNTERVIQLMKDGVDDCYRNLGDRMDNAGLEWVDSSLKLYTQRLMEEKEQYQFYAKYGNQQCKESFVNVYKYIDNGIRNYLYNKEHEFKQLMLSMDTLSKMHRGLFYCQDSTTKKY